MRFPTQAPLGSAGQQDAHLAASPTPRPTDCAGVDAVQFGDAKRFVEYVLPGDYVFFSHKHAGVVAVGRIKNGPVQAPDPDTWTRPVEFLTKVPQRDETIRALSFRSVSQLLDRSFFWARTIKVPYLSVEESKLLLEEMKKQLG